MRAPSGQWFKDIADTRDAPWDGLSGPKSPVMPWIHPVLHPEIKSLIERWGVERTLAPKDPVLGASERVDQLVMVKSGITARCVSSPFAQSRLSVAIGLPGRLACGNLNFFTGRPCVGRYFALVPSVVVSVPQELVMSLAKKNTEFLLLIAAQFELAALSDRLGFAAETLLDIDERVLAFFMSWASVYGKLTEIDGETWVDMPLILRGRPLPREARNSEARAPVVKKRGRNKRPAAPGRNQPPFYGQLIERFLLYSERMSATSKPASVTAALSASGFTPSPSTVAFLLSRSTAALVTPATAERAF